MKLSIIIPCYNEKKTIKDLINKVCNLDIDKQIILIDDNSNDGTKEIINGIKDKVDKIIFHEKNLGKGAGIISAKKIVNGDFVVIQDADLEYDPDDLLIMFKHIMKNNYDVLYGSRVLRKKRYNNNDFTSNFRIFANHILTIFSNIINTQNLTDAHTCYKMFSKKVFNEIELQECDFAFCPEITTKISNLGIPIYEIPISYKGRTYKDGKKISFKDGFKAIYTIIKYSKKIKNK